MKIRPIGDNILVRRLAPEGQVASIYKPNKFYKVDSPNAIQLPDAWVAKSIRGEVVAVGRGTLSAMGHLFPLSVRPGDIVWFDWQAGSEIGVGDTNLLIIKESDILGVEGK